MSAISLFLSKLADRPSTTWRIAWLTFCLLVVCFFGARTLRRITPYVLAGIGDSPTPPLLPEGEADKTDDDGKFVTWVFPAISWLMLLGIVMWLLLQAR